MELPFGGTFAKDTFETGTRAAAFGGTTTIVDFAVQIAGPEPARGPRRLARQGRGQRRRRLRLPHDHERRQRRHARGDGPARRRGRARTSSSSPPTRASSSATTAAIFRAMQQTGKNGGLIMMHAENGMAIDIVAADLVADGKTDPLYHGIARYPIFEGEATNRVIRLAEAAQVPVYIVHLSARDALNAVRDARDRGSQAFAETCPQYLFLSLDDMGNGFEGAKFVCSPPLRSRRPPGRALDRARSRTTSRSSRPTTARSTSTARRTSARATSGRSRTACPASRTGSTCSTTAASSAGGLTKERWVEISLDGAGEAVRDVPAQGRDRRRARTPTSSSTTRTAKHTISREDPPHGRRLLVLRGPRGPGRLRRRPEPRLGHRPQRRVHRAQGRRAGSSSASTADYARMA